MKNLSYILLFILPLTTMAQYKSLTGSYKIDRLMVNRLMLNTNRTIPDTANYKLVAVNSEGRVFRFTTWPTLSVPSTLKTDLALNNVSNTSDANKPISTATQTAMCCVLN